MNLLPKYTQLGNLKLVEVYVAYDEPCLFTCKNASGQIFIAVLIDENDDYKKWLYTAISQDRFKSIKCRKIDLHDSFKLAEEEFSYIVEIPFVEEEDTIVKMISCKDISRDMLPLPGEFISINSQELVDELKKAASSLRRDILRFRVEFPNNANYEAPIKAWSSMLFSLQEVVEFIGRGLTNEPNRIIAQQTELLATATSGGSYCIDLVAATSVDLFKESLMSESLHLFLNLIEVSNKCVEAKSFKNEYINEEFTIMINNLGIPLTSKYRVFLNHIATAKSDIDFNWGSPNPKRGGSAKLTYKSITTALQLIENMEEANPLTLKITGTLIAGNVKLKKFEIKDINNDFTYKGKVSDSLIRSDTDMTLDCIYHAIIEETIESNKVTGETKPKYKLIDLGKVESQFSTRASSTKNVPQKNDSQMKLFLD
jgi:hypothetical protein